MGWYHGGPEIRLQIVGSGKISEKYEYGTPDLNPQVFMHSPFTSQNLPPRGILMSPRAPVQMLFQSLAEKYFTLDCNIKVTYADRITLATKTLRLDEAQNLTSLDDIGIDASHVLIVEISLNVPEPESEDIEPEDRKNSIQEEDLVEIKTVKDQYEKASFLHIGKSPNLLNEEVLMKNSIEKRRSLPESEVTQENSLIGKRGKYEEEENKNELNLPKQNEAELQKDFEIKYELAEKSSNSTRIVFKRKNLPNIIHSLEKIEDECQKKLQSGNNI